MGGDRVVLVVGTVTRVSGRDIGIYVSREYQHKLETLLGRRVTVLVLVEER